MSFSNSSKKIVENKKEETKYKPILIKKEPTPLSSFPNISVKKETKVRKRSPSPNLNYSPKRHVLQFPLLGKYKSSILKSDQKRKQRSFPQSPPPIQNIHPSTPPENKNNTILSFNKSPSTIKIVFKKRRVTPEYKPNSPNYTPNEDSNEDSNEESIKEIIINF